MAVKPALPIRLLVMDLDGTLLPHGGVIAERTIDAIRAARAKGVIATISSGRNVPSIIEYAHQIGLDGPLIGMQGGNRSRDSGEGRGWLGAHDPALPLPRPPRREGG